MSQNKLKEIVAIVSLLTICGCNEKTKTKSEYINHDKWMSYRDAIHRHPLKGNPKEINESVYNELSDTSTDAKGNLLHIETNRFDEEGNIMYMKLYAPVNNSQTEIFFTYDTNGMQYRSITSVNEGRDKGSGNESIYKSQHIGPGKFRRTSTFQGKPQFGTTIVSFENNGNLVTVEGLKGDSVNSRTERIFAGDTLLAWRIYQPTGISVDSYYYSRKGFLDSMVTKVNNNVSTKYVFANNDQGDPVYKLVTYYGIVTEMERFVYRYDEKGNWIRRVSYYEKDGSAKGDYPYLGHTLWVREIKY